MILLRSAWQGHYETGSNSSTRRFVPPCQCSRRQLRLVRNSRSTPAIHVIIFHARREQLADDLGERQRAVQRPARRFENQFGIHAQGLKVFRAK